MRAILDLRTNKVLRNCGSINSSMRIFAMLQIERDRLKALREQVHSPMQPTELRNYRLAIAELQTTRHIGDTVPAGEFTIIHSEK
jgi:hypothetical protein